PIPGQDLPGLLEPIIVDRGRVDPCVFSEKLLQVLGVCDVNKKNDQSATDAHEAESRRVGRGEPKAVPAFDDCLARLPGNRDQRGNAHGFSSLPALSISSRRVFESAFSNCPPWPCLARR